MMALFTDADMWYPTPMIGTLNGQEVHLASPHLHITITNLLEADNNYMNDLQYLRIDGWLGFHIFNRSHAMVDLDFIP